MSQAPNFDQFIDMVQRSVAGVARGLSPNTDLLPVLHVLDARTNTLGIMLFAQGFGNAPDEKDAFIQNLPAQFHARDWHPRYFSLATMAWMTTELGTRPRDSALRQEVVLLHTFSPDEQRVYLARVTRTNKATLTTSWDIEPNILSRFSDLWSMIDLNATEGSPPPP